MDQHPWGATDGEGFTRLGCTPALPETMLDTSVGGSRDSPPTLAHLAGLRTRSVKLGGMEPNVFSLSLTIPGTSILPLTISSPNLSLPQWRMSERVFSYTSLSSHAPSE